MNPAPNKSSMGSMLRGNSGFRGNTGGNLGNMSATGFKEKRPHGYEMGHLKNFTPQQMELFSQLFSNVGPDSFLSRLAGGDEETFNEMEAPAMRGFNDTLAGIANRFSGGGFGAQGALGAQKSSGFRNTLSSAASNFQQDLQSRRQGLQRQALMDLMGISSNLLGQQPYQNYLVPKQQKQGTNWGGAIGAGLGAIGGSLGGPFGAVQGASFGSQIGSAFV